MKNFYLVALLLVSISKAQNAADMDMNFNPFNVPENQYLNEAPIKKILAQPDGKLLILSSASLSRFSNNQSDNTFNTGTGFNAIEYVYDFVIQPDGKIIVVGGFNSYNGETVKNIIRLNPDGSRDTSFAVIETEMGGFIEHINLLPDGKMLISGGFVNINNVAANGLIRLNADGTRDTNFVSALNLGTYKGTTVRLQPDNKILVSKKTTSTTGINQIQRLNSDGSIDNTFVTGNVGFGSIANFICQNDGKIVIIGSFLSYNSTVANSIVRVNADGSIDTSFILAEGFSSYYAGSIIIQPDGKLIIGGSFTTYNNIPSSGIVRLNNDGSKDTTFNVGAGFTYNISAYTMVLLPDGKIVVGGGAHYYDNFPINFITRINTDGSRDITFTNFGKGFDNMFSTVSSKIVKQPDEKLLIVGSYGTYNDIPTSQLMRLNTNGSFDPTFRLTGRLEGSFIQPYVDSGINGIVVQPDGKILVGGNFTSYNGIAVNRIMRLNSDGSKDESFTSGYNFDNDIKHIILQPDGKIIVAGFFSGGIVRLNTDGSHDATFTNPIVLSIESIVLQTDGKILVGGRFSLMINSVRHRNMIRLLSNGSPDPSFHLDFTSDMIGNIIIQPDNQIVILVSLSEVSTFIMKRLNTDGTTDNTFAYPSSSPVLDGLTFIMLTNGKFLLHAVSTEGRSLKCFNANGTLDNTFDYGPANRDGLIYRMISQNDGKIVLLGNFFKYKGIPARRIVRLMGESAEPLVVQDFESDHFFTVYPNPANDLLNIEKKKDIEITSLSIFNILGQLMITIPNAQRTSAIDISGLESGNYFLKINSDKGVSNTKFIKL